MFFKKKFIIVILWIQELLLCYLLDFVHLFFKFCLWL